jgi:hypothetical protein
VGFQKETIGSCGGSGGQERRNELPLTSTRPGLTLPRLLDRVSGIEDHRCASCLAQSAKVPHVDHEIAIAEERPPLGDGHLSCPPAPDLLDGSAHGFGMQPLSLFDVDWLAGTASGDQKVGLAAQERGDLQCVSDLSHREYLLGLVDIGEHRKAACSSCPLECPKTLIQAGAPTGLQPGAIGFIEARLEADRNTQVMLDSRQLLGHPGQYIAGLDDAGPGDEEWYAAKRPSH